MLGRPHITDFLKSDWDDVQKTLRKLAKRANEDLKDELNEKLPFLIVSEGKLYLHLVLFNITVLIRS